MFVCVYSVLASIFNDLTINKPFMMFFATSKKSESTSLAKTKSNNYEKIFLAHYFYAPHDHDGAKNCRRNNH